MTDQPVQLPLNASSLVADLTGFVSLVSRAKPLAAAHVDASPALKFHLRALDDAEASARIAIDRMGVCS